MLHESGELHGHKNDMLAIFQECYRIDNEELNQSNASTSYNTLKYDIVITIILVNIL